MVLSFTLQVEGDELMKDDRFKMLFSNPDFQVDEESEVRFVFFSLSCFLMEIGL